MRIKKSLFVKMTATITIGVVLLLASFSIYASKDISTAKAELDNEFVPPDFTVSEKKFIEQSLTITVAGYANSAPIDYYDEKEKKQDGFFEQLLNKIHKISGLKLQRKLTANFSETRTDFDKGNIDMVMGYVDSDTPNPTFNLSVPFLPISYVYVTKTGKNIPKQPVFGCLMTSTTVYDYLHRIYPTAEIKNIADSAACYDSLTEGKIDVLLDNLYIAQNKIAKSDGKLSIGMNSKFTMNYYFMLQMNAPSELMSILNKSIEAITENEMTSMLFAATAKSFDDKPVSPATIRYMVISSVAIVALIIIIIFSILLYRKNRIISEEKKKVENTLQLTLELEQERQYREIHFGMYDRVVEIDLTNNTINYISNLDQLLSMGMAKTPTYTEYGNFIASNLISAEYKTLYQTKTKIENLLNGYTVHGIDYVEFESSAKGLTADLYEWVNVKIKLYTSHVNNHTKAVMYVTNINREKEYELDLKTKAQCDNLTGLFNKTYAQKVADEQLRNSSKPCALIMIDIDNFKSINDNFGHSYGDGVIKETAKIIAKNFRETDIVGRIGGDEYMVLMHNFGNKGVITTKLDKLLLSLKKSYTVNNVTINVSASIGIAIRDDNNYSFSTLYLNADKALYESKNKGKNQFTFFKS